jgi:hypothetical protein
VVAGHSDKWDINDITGSWTYREIWAVARYTAKQDKFRIDFGGGRT